MVKGLSSLTASPRLNSFGRRLLAAEEIGEEGPPPRDGHIVGREAAIEASNGDAIPRF